MLNVRNASQGRWVEILTRLGADASSLDGKHRPCPSCAGTDRFRFDDQDGRGSHICSQCGAGDGFDLVQKMFSYSFKDAAQAVEGVLGIEGNPPSREEQQAYKKKLADEQAKRAKTEKEAHRITANESLAIWEGSALADNSHAYLKAKQVKAYGINMDGEDLLIPVRIGGNITSIQRIKPDGSKLFQKGGEISSGYHSIVGADVADMSRIYVAEGYATGATIREATGCHVAVAFNAGNLGKVAKAIRSKLPDIQIIIAGDNDESKTGEIKGKTAADSVGGLFVMPPDVGSDWNDYAATHGLDAVGDKIGKQINGAEKQPCPLGYSCSKNDLARDDIRRRGVVDRVAFMDECCGHDCVLLIDELVAIDLIVFWKLGHGSILLCFMAYTSPLLLTAARWSCIATPKSK